MKKFLPIAAVLLTITFAFTSCGLSDKVYEMQQEKIIENVLGDEANVDIDGDSFVLEDKEGNVVTVGGAEWPTGKAAELLPKLDKGSIASGLTSDLMCTINVEGIEKKDFEDYLQKVKDKGFTNNTIEMTDEGTFTYISNKEDNEWVQIYYNGSEKTLDILVGIDEEKSEY